MTSGGDERQPRSRASKGTGIATLRLAGDELRNSSIRGNVSLTVCISGS
jgi:hypothetical protein